MVQTRKTPTLGWEEHSMKNLQIVVTHFHIHIQAHTGTQWDGSEWEEVEEKLFNRACVKMEKLRIHLDFGELICSSGCLCIIGLTNDEVTRPLIVQVLEEIMVSKCAQSNWTWMKIAEKTGQSWLKVSKSRRFDWLLHHWFVWGKFLLPSILMSSNGNFHIISKVYNKCLVRGNIYNDALMYNPNHPGHQYMIHIKTQCCFVALWTTVCHCLILFLGPTLANWYFHPPDKWCYIHTEEIHIFWILVWWLFIINIHIN